MGHGAGRSPAGPPGRGTGQSAVRQPATARYPSEADAIKQRGRDYIKIGISMTRGIRLVVVHPEDLTLDGIQQKVKGLLPLRSTDGHGPLAECLNRMSDGYRQKVQQGRL